MSEDEALKIGRRNNRMDARRIQSMHDMARELGAECDTEDDGEGKAATVTSDPAETVILSNGDAEKAIGRREDTDPEAGAREYGDVEFADPVNKKYPIDTEEHIRAAYSYINQERNQAKYSAEEVAAIKRKIIAAWKKKIDPAGPPGTEGKSVAERLADMFERWGNEDAVDNVLIAFGSAVKALGGGKVGGYLVRFGNADDTDVEGDYFTKDTDYGIDPGDKTRVYYNHGMNKTLGKRRLGSGTLNVDDVGVWVEAELDLADKYQAAIHRMVEAGRLGWSSGSAAHLVEREPDGKAARITAWPLGLDASLTPTPAEPRNAAIPLKSWQYDAEPELLEAEPEAGGEPAAQAADGEAVKASQDVSDSNSTGEDRMDEKILETLGAMKTAFEAVAAEVKELKEFKAKVEAEPPTQKAGYVDPMSGKDEKPFKSLAAQLDAVRQVAMPGGNAEAMNRLKAIKAPSGLNEGVPSDGGFLVQQDLLPGVWQRTYEESAILSRVRRLQIGADANGLKMNAIAETSRATGSRYGGVQGYWLAEAGTKTASHPTFRQIELNLHKWAAVCYATDELLADTTALASIIMDAFPKEARFQIEDAFIRGTGAGQPLGILNAACLVSVAKEAGQAADTVVSENVMKMWSRLWAPSRRNAVWLVNQDVEPQLWSLSLNVGTGGLPVYLPAGGLSSAPYSTLFGRPVIAIEQADTVGDQGDIILADFGEYVTIDKGGVQNASSIHVRFLYDEMTYRFVYRIDGQPVWNSALTPYQSANTLSPFVVLDARA